MVQINFALKEVNCKIVYYGPGLSGKTTNLEVIHSKAPKNNVGDLTSIATEGDRTLFFDFLPLNLGSVAGMQTKFQIYTVPGQVYYNSTRKLVLQGADGIGFVADSRRGKMDENIESLQNLMENIEEYGMDIKTIPLVLQYNKRDLPDVYGVEELEDKLNFLKVPYFEAVAVTGEGVFPTLKKLSAMVLENLNRQQGSTAVRAPKPKQAVKETVGAGVQSRSAAASGGGRPPAPRQASGSRAQPQATGKKPGARVVRESVTSSSGVKQIQRKAPRVDSPRKRPNTRPSRGKKRLDQEPSRESKSPVMLWVAIFVGLLVAAGAGLYFSGLLDSFLGR